MAGEVKTQLTITLAGGVGPSAGAGSQSVSRQSDLRSPGQSMSSYAADRQLRWSRVTAMEMARDRQAMAEIHQGLEKLEVQRSLEVSSARRAAEARARERNAFADRVRASRAGMLDDEFSFGPTGRRLTRAGSAASKRLLKGFGVGIAASIGAQTLVPDDGGGAGAFSRIAISTISGGAWGGVPGAAGQFLSTAISELVRRVSAQDEGIANLRREIASNKKEAQQAIDDTHKELREFNVKLKEEFEAEMDRIIHGETISRYREERFQGSNLVN